MGIKSCDDIQLIDQRKRKTLGIVLVFPAISEPWLEIKNIMSPSVGVPPKCADIVMYLQRQYIKLLGRCCMRTRGDQPNNDTKILLRCKLGNASIESSESTTVSR